MNQNYYSKYKNLNLLFLFNLHLYFNLDKYFKIRIITYRR